MAWTEAEWETIRSLQFSVQSANAQMNSVAIAVARVETKMDAYDSRMAGVKKTIYGENGDNGVVGDVRDLKTKVALTKGLLVYFVLPMLTGVGIVAVTTILGA